MPCLGGFSFLAHAVAASLSRSTYAASEAAVMNDLRPILTFTSSPRPTIP